mgnify:CR=1 FL=1
MNANDISFGIEIESTIPNTSPVRVGPYHRGTPVAQLPTSPDGEQWKAESDTSIHPPTGRRGCEFVSPKLQGEEGLQHAHKTITEIRDDLGAKVNSSCGIHVTVTFPRNDGPALARLVTFCAHFERGLYATTGTKRREQGIYCNPNKCHGEHPVTNKAKANAYIRHAKRARFSIVNLTHLAHGRDRVEFRLFSGSVNPDKILGWVRLILAIVEFSLNTNRCVSYESRSSDNRWGGEGECSVVGMLCKLGWLKWTAWGYRGKTYGELETEGTSIPTIDKIVARLRGLAKKYDAC